MAELVAAMCDEHGVTHVTHDPSIWNKDSIAVEITDARTGLSVSVDFDKGSIQPNVFVLSWHFHSSKRDHLVNPAVFHDHNPYHFRKATDVAHGWYNLKAILERRLKQIADGTATVPGEEATPPPAKEVSDG